MAQGHPVPTFPREQGKERLPSLAQRAGEGWGPHCKLMHKPQHSES